jgi:hypothetical protein
MSYFPFFKNFEFCSRPYFTKENQIYLSKLRIIQKNLVHFQGFPDNIADKNLLAEKEYFGQYGNILKIVVVSKYDEVSKKKSKSAYITFSSNEEAAYAILAVDSIEIDGQIVRAFFGTSKYCVHFLNNEECFNKEKCMFIHELADDNDVLGINSKFGYSEHIKLAKKIINYDSILTKNYINGLNISYHTELPNIKYIYLKEDLVNSSELEFKQTRSDSTSSETSYTSHNSSTSIDNSDIKNFSNKSHYFKLYKKSRFFSSNDNEIEIDNDNNINNELEIVNLIIINLLLRFPFFNKFNDFIPLNKMELEYCINLSKKIGGNVYLNYITNFKV